MKKVLLYHKQLTSLLGGGTFQPLMFLAELQKRCDVTLALNEGTDLAAVARMADIGLDTAKVRVVVLDPPPESRLHRFPSLLALRRARRLKRLAREADVCISTANVADFGKPGHHFIYLLSQFGGAAFYDYLMQTKGRRGCGAFGGGSARPSSRMSSSRSAASAPSGESSPTRANASTPPRTTSKASCADSTAISTARSSIRRPHSNSMTTTCPATRCWPFTSAASSRRSA